MHIFETSRLKMKKQDINIFYASNKQQDTPIERIIIEITITYIS